MIYMFLSDEALWGNTSGITPESGLNQGVGFLTEFAANYFNTIEIIPDERASRLDVLTDKGKGDMRLYTDSDRFPNGTNPFIGGTAEEYAHLFNTIEYVMLQNDTRDDLNDHMDNHQATFGGYITDSLDVSADMTSVDFHGENGLISNVQIRAWASFAYNINNENVPITVYFNENSFRQEYPYCTITRVIFPAEPSTFLDMSSYSSVVDAIAESANYVNNQLSAEVAPKDHNGAYNFITRYHDAALVSDFNFSFTVLYKGKAPTIIQARVATREALLATGLADEATWKQTFPDLWITARFYIVPNWRNFKDLPTKTIYPSIDNVKTILDDLRLIFPSYTHIDEKVEFMINSSSTMILAALYSELNDLVYDSVQAQHPTYLDVDATSPAWDDQELHTAEFNQNLSDAMGVLLGGDNVYAFSTTLDHQRNWLTFVTNYMEYLVLGKDQHPFMFTP